MPRKLKLSRKKNEERKKYHVTTRPVSISLADITVFRVSINLSPLHTSGEDEHSPITRRPPELKISLPLSCFTCLPLPTVRALHSRITTAQLLPSGWVDGTRCEQELTLCRLTSDPDRPTPSIRFTITIVEDFTWIVFFHAQRLEKDSSCVLQEVPSTVRSPNEIARLTTVIDCSKLCVGNPDDKFIPLLSRREGTFKDQSGMN